MEDSHIVDVDLGKGYSVFAILDGHAGAHVAEFAGNHLVEHVQRHVDVLLPDATNEQWANAISLAFSELDATILKRFGRSSRGGTTCTGCIITDRYYHFFNLGDSRCVLCANSEVKFATRDHKPSDAIERTRIENAGGFVMRDRINGMLAVSRAFGDSDYKTGPPGHAQMVSCEPTCDSILRSSSDEFIMLACDGVWDVISSAGAVQWVQSDLAREMSAEIKKRRRRWSQREVKAERALEQTCSNLLTTCLAKGSYDNMSVTIVVPAALEGELDGLPSVELQLVTPSSHAEVVAALSTSVVASAISLGVAVALSSLNPAKSRLQRRQTISSRSDFLEVDDSTSSVV